MGEVRKGPSALKKGPNGLVDPPTRLLRSASFTGRTTGVSHSQGLVVLRPAGRCGPELGGNGGRPAAAAGRRRAGAEACGGTGAACPDPQSRKGGRRPAHAEAEAHASAGGNSDLARRNRDSFAL